MGIHPPFFPADHQIALLDLKTSQDAQGLVAGSQWRGGRGGRAAAGGHAGPKVPKIQSSYMSISSRLGLPFNKERVRRLDTVSNRSV